MIILTGGAGFIGSCFLHKLNENGYGDVVVVDHLAESDKWKNLLGKDLCYFEHKEIFRKKLAKGKYQPKSIDYIIHLGACSKTTERNADYIMDNNLSYSIELAEFAIRNNIPFMYASSAATYGDGREGYSDLSFDKLEPLNVYGLTKHLFDKWVIANGHIDKVIGLKYFNVFGPNEYHKDSMTSMVYKAYHQIAETGKVRLFKSTVPEYSDGGQMRDFVYVKDAVEVMWKMFKLGNEFSGIYNLGTGKARSWNELANATFAAMDKPSNIEYTDMPESLAKQYQNYTQAEAVKLIQAGIVHNYMSLEESVADYVQNYLSKGCKIL